MLHRENLILCYHNQVNQNPVGHISVGNCSSELYCIVVHITFLLY